MEAGNTSRDIMFYSRKRKRNSSSSHANAQISPNIGTKSLSSPTPSPSPSPPTTTRSTSAMAAEKEEENPLPMEEKQGIPSSENYLERYQNCKLLVEREVKFSLGDCPRFAHMIMCRGWYEVIKPRQANDNLVKEFYASLRMGIVYPYTVYLRGQKFEFSPSRIEAYYDLNRSRPESKLPPVATDMKVVVAELYGKPEKIPFEGLEIRKLTPYYQLVQAFVLSNIEPNSNANTSTLSLPTAKLLFNIGSGREFDIGHYIASRILKVVKSDRKGDVVLPFGSLISGLAMNQMILFHQTERASLSTAPPIRTRDFFYNGTASSKVKSSYSSCNQNGQGIDIVTPVYTIQPSRIDSLEKRMNSVESRLSKKTLDLSRRIDSLSYQNAQLLRTVNAQPQSKGKHADVNKMNALNGNFEQQILELKLVQGQKIEALSAQIAKLQRSLSLSAQSDKHTDVNSFDCDPAERGLSILARTIEQL